MHILWHKFMDHMEMVHISMGQNRSSNDIILRWLIIDSGSTYTMIWKPDLLKYIHGVDYIILVTYNEVQKVVKVKGLIGLYGYYLWYGKGGVVKILSPGKICNICRLTVDRKCMEFIIWLPMVHIKFKNISKVLFYYYTITKGSMSFVLILGGTGHILNTGNHGKYSTTTKHTIHVYTRHDTTQECRSFHVQAIMGNTYSKD